MIALMTTAWASAQTEDQLALKRLVDTFSNLADVKDVKTQMDLFTDDAEVHSRLLPTILPCLMWSIT